MNSMNANQQSEQSIDPLREKNTGDYRSLRLAIYEWYPHRVGWFSSGEIDSQFKVYTREGKHNRWIILERLVKAGKLEKHPFTGKHRVIDKTVDIVEWWKADPNKTLELNWPRGIEDDTNFGLDNVLIYPQSPIIVAGVSNMGKSTWLLNFMIENMDKYPCLYMTSEWSPEQCSARLRNFDWVELLNGDGTPKFKMIKRYRDWQDVIEPNSINLIDFVRVDKDFFIVPAIINACKQKLDGGIVVIAIQKSKFKEFGVGGEGTLDDAQLYLNIDYEKLTIIKAKSYRGDNPNGKKYSFKIVEHGSRFHDIQRVIE